MYKDLISDFIFVEAVEESIQLNTLKTGAK